MSSYHTMFEYLNGTSAAYGLRITTFEPDDGAMDTFLNMEQVYTDSYDGTRRRLYGMKYNSVATITITVIKQNGSDFSVSDNRRILKWLTGNKASWLNLYEGNTIAYSFYGSFVNVQQQKLDARVIGLVLTFESTSPFAYSSKQVYGPYSFGDHNLHIDDDGVVHQESNDPFNINANGIVYLDDAEIKIDNYGVIYTGEDSVVMIDNLSDDKFSCVPMDVSYMNRSGNEKDNVLTITNIDSGESTEITGISLYENIMLHSNQFITSNRANKIFGDSFNFCWPKLVPLVETDDNPTCANRFVINGSGKGDVLFTFRYPIKIGDCAVNINKIINNPVGCGAIDDWEDDEDNNVEIVKPMSMRINGDYLQYTSDGIKWHNLIPVSEMASAIGKHMTLTDDDILTFGN